MGRPLIPMTVISGLTLLLALPARAGELGIEISDPAISAAVATFNDGGFDEAQKTLQTAEAQKGTTLEQKSQVKLARAILYMRTSQASDALKLLRPMSDFKDDTLQRCQARLLLRTAARVQKLSPSQQNELKSVDAWHEQLRATLGDLAHDLETKDNALIDVCEKGDWTQVDPQLEQGRDLCDQIDAISAEPAAADRTQALKKHTDRIKNAVDSAQQKVNALKPEHVHDRREVRRGGHSQEEQNKVRADEKAIDAGNEQIGKLKAEHARLVEKYDVKARSGRKH